MPHPIPSPSPKEAAAAIVALINSSPRSPRQDEIEAILARVGCAPAQEAPISDLRFRLRKAMANSSAAVAVVARLPQGAEFDIAHAELVMWEDEIAAMEKDIPNPPRSFQDLVARAEVARHGGDVVDGKLMEAEDEEDVFLGPAGRLVEAVLQFRGASSATAMSPEHAEHYREWRGLIDAHMCEFEKPSGARGITRESKAGEARMAAHMMIIDATADKILAEPVRAWGDLLPCAEVAFWYQWAGVDPQGPHAISQMEAGPMSGGEAIDLAIAKLLNGIFTLTGIGQFAEVRHG